MTVAFVKRRSISANELELFECMIHNAVILRMNEWLSIINIEYNSVSLKRGNLAQVSASSVSLLLEIERTPTIRRLTVCRQKCISEHSTKYISEHSTKYINEHSTTSNMITISLICNYE